MSADTGPLVDGIADTAVAGVALLLTGGISLLGIVTAEAYHPDYATTDEISDLGSTAPPNPVRYEPTATIFNGTMLTSGAIVLAAAYLLYRAGRPRVLWLPLGVFGVGVFGVGVVPGNVTPWHGRFALLASPAAASQRCWPHERLRGRSPTSVCFSGGSRWRRCCTRWRSEPLGRSPGSSSAASSAGWSTRYWFGRRVWAGFCYEKTA